MQKRTWLLLFILVGVMGGVGIFLTNRPVLEYENRAYSSVHDVPETRVALVFGGGMYDEHTQSDLQIDRVMRAVELYNAGKVEELLMTGDDGANRFNEVDAMHAYAVAAGVPDDDVHIDPHGYNTHKSCYRAKHIFQLEEVIAISQSFHLSRIQYFCESLGVKTVALSADIHPYGTVGKIWHMNIRESLARTKAWTEVNVTHPIPTILGQPIELK